MHIDGLDVDITDGYDYHVTADSKQIHAFAAKYNSNLLKADFLMKDFDKYQELYVVIDKGKLLQTFTTFDEYLESPLSDEM